MTPARVWAVVVARTGPTTKSRLATVLGPEERTALALRMLEAVVTACSAAGLGGVLVVTDSPAGLALARALGARTLDDPGSGLNAAVSAGISALGDGGAAVDGVLVLPGDVPRVQAADVLAIVAAAGDLPRVAVVVPDHARRGTNALLLRPPTLVAPAFGEPSYERHVRLARAAGAAIELAVHNLAVDIDEPSALETLAAPLNESA